MATPTWGEAAAPGGPGAAASRSQAAFRCHPTQIRLQDREPGPTGSLPHWGQRARLLHSRPSHSPKGHLSSRFRRSHTVLQPELLTKTPKTCSCDQAFFVEHFLQSDKEGANTFASQHEDLQPQQASVPHHHPPLAAGLQESPGGTEKFGLILRASQGQGSRAQTACPCPGEARQQREALPAAPKTHQWAGTDHCISTGASQWEDGPTAWARWYQHSPAHGSQSRVPHHQGSPSPSRLQGHPRLAPHRCQPLPCPPKHGAAGHHWGAAGSSHSPIIIRAQTPPVLTPASHTGGSGCLREDWAGRAADCWSTVPNRCSLLLAVPAPALPPWQALKRHRRASPCTVPRLCVRRTSQALFPACKYPNTSCRTVRVLWGCWLRTSGNARHDGGNSRGRGAAQALDGSL